MHIYNRNSFIFEKISQRMMRKIMKVGPTTLVVSLPSNWAKQFKLKKGNELMLDIQGNSLRVSALGAVEPKEAVLDLRGHDHLLHLLISNLYKVGYKKITISFIPEKTIWHRYRKITHLDLIKSLVDHLTGMDIDEMRKTRQGSIIILKERAQLSSEEFSHAFNKLFFHLSNQAEQVSMHFKGRPVSREEVRMMERLINQASDFCLRILNTQGYHDYMKTAIVFSLVTKLEEIGDEYFNLFLYADQKKVRLDERQIALLLSINQQIKDIYLLVNKFSDGAYDAFSERIVKHFAQFEEIAEKNITKEQLRCCFFIYSILQKCRDLLETSLAINHEKFSP